jgi:hypothetical protein
VNVVTLPTQMLWAGHVPDLCVRHGASAVARMSFYRGAVQNWPYCPECVKSRKVNLALAVTALALPFLAMLVGIGVLHDDPVATATFTDVIWVFLGAGIIVFWYLLLRYVTPSGLAKAKLTGNNMWLVMQGVHPAFAAHANDLLQRTGAAQVSPTGQLIQPDVFAPPPTPPQPEPRSSSD